MPGPSPSILVVAGEVSGDLHLSRVIAHIQARLPQVHFFGAGGDLMKTQGVNLLAYVRELGVMGFTDLPSLLPRLVRLRNQILHQVRVDRSPLAILTDYPGFNLHLARHLKRLPHPPRILYYIAPQVWAWRPQRIAAMQHSIDALAVIIPFEEELFRSHNLNARFVGHPLLDSLSGLPLMPLESRPIDLALLPGSRISVVKRVVSILTETASILKKRYPHWRVGISQMEHIPTGILKPFIDRYGWLEPFSEGHRLLSSARYAIVSSGTATLEAALLSTPQIVVYRTSFFNYLIARRVVRIPNVSLVNIIASRKLVPELLQRELKPQTAAQLIEKWEENPSLKEAVLEGYHLVRLKLGEPGAAQRVAEWAIELMKT